MSMGGFVEVALKKRKNLDQSLFYFHLTKHEPREYNAAHYGNKQLNMEI